MGGDTCIVDHDVHSAPFMDQAVFELLQVSDLGDITALVKRLDAQILQFGQRLLAPLVVDIGNGDFPAGPGETQSERDRKSTRLNSSHVRISYAVFCLKKKKNKKQK